MHLISCLTDISFSRESFPVSDLLRVGSPCEPRELSIVWRVQSWLRQPLHSEMRSLSRKIGNRPSCSSRGMGETPVPDDTWNIRWIPPATTLPPPPSSVAFFQAIGSKNVMYQSRELRPAVGLCNLQSRSHPTHTHSFQIITLTWSMFQGCGVGTFKGRIHPP